MLGLPSLITPCPLSNLPAAEKVLVTCLKQEVPYNSKQSGAHSAEAVQFWINVLYINLYVYFYFLYEMFRILSLPQRRHRVGEIFNS